MKFNWQRLETVLLDIFRIGTEAAEVAEPIVVATKPGIANVYNIAVTAAVAAEAAGENAAATQVTNEDKTAAVAAAVTPVLAQATQNAGLTPHTQDQIAAYSQSVVDGLNALAGTQSN